MVFDNEIAKMTPGQALMDVPIPTLIENTAKAIAKAQYELDASSVRVATMMSDTKIPFVKADGERQEKSLLELGFVPTFYHFSETEMEFHVLISVKVEKGLDVTFDGSVGSAEQDGVEAMKNSYPVAFGATLNVDVHHKYEFDMSASCTIKTKMKALPPPTIFISTLQSHIGAGGTIASE